MQNRITRDLYREISKVKNTVNDAEKRITELQDKLLTNLLYEKANETLPFNYTELFEEAKALRASADAAPETLTDNAASFVPSLFPTLNGSGALIEAGTRINYNNKLYRATAALWDSEENTPTNAPTLWELVTYKEGIREIPETITASSAFAKGELGLWNGAVYESLIDNNVWTPAQYSAGWLVRGDN